MKILSFHDFQQSSLHLDYNKYVRDNVTKTYKCSATNRIKNINYKSKSLGEKLVTDNTTEKMEETEAYVAVKDHTEGFPHKLSFGLINPSKSDTGKISKNLLNKVNKLMVLNSNVN